MLVNKFLPLFQNAFILKCQGNIMHFNPYICATWERVSSFQYTLYKITVLFAVKFVFVQINTSSGNTELLISVYWC